ncbi:MAG: hypothetical protein JXR50_01570 [Prolixibacteraceae bacterium]|nr:hypothetical protein [Prolixibacteraceae bacterium]
MKKILFTTLCFCLALLSVAQEQGIDSKKTYLKIGMSSLGANIFGLNDGPDKNMKKKAFEDLKINAYNFEFGSLYGINMIELGDQFQVGIDVNYLTVNFFQLAEEDETDAEKVSNFAIGSAIGPVFTYAPTNSIELDAFFKVNPTWIAGNIDSSNDQKYGYLGFEGMKYKIGFNARFDILMLSAEFNPGYAVLQDWDYSDEYLGNIGEQDDKSIPSDEWSKKTPTPLFNFSIGLCF